MKKLAALLVLAFFCSNTGLFAQKQKVDQRLWAELEAGASLPFLVVFEDQADVSGAEKLRTKTEKGRLVFEKLSQKAAGAQGPTVDFLRSKNAPVNSFFIANALATAGDFELLRSLAARPEIGRIERDPSMRLQFFEEKNAASDRGPLDWNLQMIGIDSVWASGVRGGGAVVAGEDTGYEWTHPALQKSYRGTAASGTADHNFNWHDAIHAVNPLNSGDNPCGLDAPAPCDDQSHGTHTMGTMAGDGGSGFEIGLAPEARWIGCRNMERGWGRPSTYIECFQFFLAPTDLAGQNADPSKAPDLVNNSWYCAEIEGCDSTFDSKTMEIAVENLRAAGIVVVVSNGNFGPGCSSFLGPPADFEGSFSVGATASNDTIAGFSTRGPGLFDGQNLIKPNVSAPGVNIRSSVLGGGYANYSGTSMAGPHVAGLVALLISANPALRGQVEAIETIIEQTAVPKFSAQECGGVAGSSLPNNVYGWGRIDAWAAVKMAQKFAVSTETAEKTPFSVVFRPNPFGEELFLESKKMASAASVEIFDATGRLLFSKKWDGKNALRIDAAHWPTGLVFFKIADEKGATASGRLVKN